MTKSKFILTESLVKVESEPVQNTLPVTPLKKNEPKTIDRLSINIDGELKRRLRFFCIDQRKNLTEVIEIAIREHLEKFDS